MLIFPFTVCPSPPSSLLVFFPHFLSLPFLSFFLALSPSLCLFFLLALLPSLFLLSLSLYFHFSFLFASSTSPFPRRFLSLSFCLFLSPSASLPRLAWTYSPACKAKQQNRSSTSHKIFIHLGLACSNGTKRLDLGSEEVAKTWCDVY